MGDLSGFRGNDNGGHGAPVDDFTEPGMTPDLAAQTHAPDGNDGEAVDPPHVSDPRAALAAKFAARRAAARQSIVPRSHVPSIDGDITDPDDPDYIAPMDDDDSSHGRSQQDPAGQEPAPPVSSQPSGERRFSLKVDGNTFDVSLSELRRYAGVEDDDQLPEVSLVRAAQINLAAQSRLDEAKREREASKYRQTATDSGIPADEEPSASHDAQTRRSAKPGSETVDLVRDIQYGDPEEAAAKIEQYLENRLTQRETTRTAQSIVEEVQSHIGQFGTENADLASDDLAAEAVKGLMVRGIVSELKKHGITDSEAVHLMNNPEIASRAYVGARAQGLAVRPMKSLLDDAGNMVRARFGMARGETPKPTATPQPQPTTSRRDEKRTLVSQPAPSGMPPERRQPGNGTQDRKSVASARIAQMKASRFQA